jgi:hypothetical protein
MRRKTSGGCRRLRRVEPNREINGLVGRGKARTTMSSCACGLTRTAKSGRWAWGDGGIGKQLVQACESPHAGRLAEAAGYAMKPWIDPDTARPEVCGNAAGAKPKQATLAQVRKDWQNCNNSHPQAAALEPLLQDLQATLARSRMARPARRVESLHNELAHARSLQTTTHRTLAPNRAATKANGGGR